MKKFYGKIKVRGTDLTIAQDGIMIFDKHQKVEKEDSWRICDYLVNEGYFNKKDIIRVDIVRPIPR